MSQKKRVENDERINFIATQRWAEYGHLIVNYFTNQILLNVDGNREHFLFDCHVFRTFFIETFSVYESKWKQESFVLLGKNESEENNRIYQHKILDFLKKDLENLGYICDVKNAKSFSQHFFSQDGRNQVNHCISVKFKPYYSYKIQEVKNKIKSFLKNKKQASD